MQKFIVLIIRLVAVAAVVAFSGLLYAFPVLWFWNGCLVDLGVRPLEGVMHAWGILILCGLLFKSTSSSRS
jgi:hypothetical protein